MALYTDQKHISDTNYSHISIIRHFNGKELYQANILGKKKIGYRLKELALFVDTTLIHAGQEPVNILKRV
jgi:hypothetical protein